MIDKEAIFHSDPLDDSDDLIDFLSPSPSAKETKSIRVEFPNWMINRLDEEASKLAVSKQSLVKMWIAERLMK